jgi:hypothetical protein
MLTYVPATPAHVHELLPDLRDEDRQELLSASGLDPAIALTLCLTASEVAWAALDPQGRPIVLFGASSPSPGLGSPWMVASRHIAAQAAAVARDTRPITEALNDRYPVLTNAVDSRNRLHIRWLQWAGFAFTGTSITAADGTPFREFIRIKNHVRSTPRGAGSGIDGPVHRRPDRPVPAATAARGPDAG